MGEGMHFSTIWRRKIWAFSRWTLSSGAFVISMYVTVSPKKLWIRQWIPWNFHADQHKESCNFTWGWLVRPCIAKNVEANPKFRNSEPVVLGCVISGDAKFPSVYTVTVCFRQIKFTCMESLSVAHAKTSANLKIIIKACFLSLK